MNVTQDQFLLKWNNHQNNLVEVFSFLRTQDAFVDVTLACDGKSFPAHKVVLSACSPYFQSLFQNNPCKHPIVFLKDVKSHDMEALIEFIYKGEVSVSQIELASLISTAENLKIKGLAEPEKPPDKHPVNLNKRLASPQRLGQQQLLQQPLNNAAALHAAPMYLQSTPSVKRKRVDAYGNYSTYLGTANPNSNGSAAVSTTILRTEEKECKSGGILTCTNGPTPNSVVVDINNPATHRLVESVVNSNGGGGASVQCVGGNTPSQVVLLPVPGEDHLTGELTYNTSSHHALSTSSDAVLYSVAGTAIYVGRVSGGSSDDSIPSREQQLLYTANPGDHYASSDEGGALPPNSGEHSHESIKLEPNPLPGDPWCEPASTNSSDHSYDDNNTTNNGIAHPPALSSPNPPPTSSHPSPLHLHTPPTSSPIASDLSSPHPPGCVSSSNGASSASVVVGTGPQHISIAGITLQAEDVSDSNHHHHRTVDDKTHCIDMSNFTSNSNASDHLPTCSSSNSGNSPLSSTMNQDGSMIEMQGCLIKGEPGSITSGTMRRLLECEHCHKFFTSRFNLQRHQLIHTGAKPYNCPLCLQRFNQSGHVKTHLRTRHPNHELSEGSQLSAEHRSSGDVHIEHISSNSFDKKDLDDSDDGSTQHITVQHVTLHQNEEVEQMQRVTEHL